MKNPVNIAKKSYSEILQISSLAERLESIIREQQTIKNEINQIKSLLSQQPTKDDINQINSALNNLQYNILTENKTNSLRFAALYKKPKENHHDTNKRFLESIQPTNGALRIFQLGNVKLLKSFIDICKKNKLPYFAQSGTLLGAVRHNGFVPWDDDTDVAMFRDDIIKLKNILKDNGNYRLELVYGYNNKCRQIRFKAINTDNPCFIDIYIYDYGDDDSDKAWEKWHKQKIAISNKIKNENPELDNEWKEASVVEENSPLGEKLKPIFKKYFESLLNPRINKNNYSTINWGLDNFPIGWKRLFKKDFIFPTTPLTYEGLKIAAPKEYKKYLERQYGDIYELPYDLVTHIQHIDQTKIDTKAIKAFLQSDD